MLYLLGNKMRSNYEEFALSLLKRLVAYYNKVHFLNSHLECLPEKLSSMNDEQEERSYQISRSGFLGNEAGETKI